MKSLFLNSLYIFEYKNKKAKRVDFDKGINIITSDITNGNDVGKSVLLKSIYHTLGADAFFDSKWNSEIKTYLVSFNINDDLYYIYRNENLFKVFNERYEKLFSTMNRKELAEFLGSIFDFFIKLPKRYEDTLEVAPPVYSYLLNYVDQDHMNGTQFSSFKNLGQYSDFKENVIYNHFGIFNDEYFDLLKNIEILKKVEKLLVDEKLVIENMLQRIKLYLEGVDAPTDLSLLNIELDRKKDEYADIVTKLKKIKNKLVELRNDKFDLETSIKELELRHREDSKIFNKISHHKCPICSQDVEDETELRIKRSNQLEDYFIMKDELEGLLLEVDRKLAGKEKDYTQLLEILDVYENNLKINESKISDSLKHMGYMETQENMIKELGTVSDQLKNTNKEIKTLNSKLKKYIDLKNVANSLYEEFMTESKIDFGLEEIGSDKIKNIRQNYEARGSNKAISTIIWYFNLLRIKIKLNENTIRFPLVLDSPNNVESDETKEQALFELIFTNISNHVQSQLILSTLGFDKRNYSNVQFGRVIELTNEKYQVLNHSDYENNKILLERIFEGKLEHNEI